MNLNIVSEIGKIFCCETVEYLENKVIDFML